VRDLRPTVHRPGPASVATSAWTSSLRRIAFGIGGTSAAGLAASKTFSSVVVAGAPSEELEISWVSVAAGSSSAFFLASMALGSACQHGPEGPSQRLAQIAHTHKQGSQGCIVLSARLSGRMNWTGLPVRSIVRDLRLTVHHPSPASVAPSVWTSSLQRGAFGIGGTSAAGLAASKTFSSVAVAGAPSEELEISCGSATPALLDPHPILAAPRLLARCVRFLGGHLLGCERSLDVTSPRKALREDILWGEWVPLSTAFPRSPGNGAKGWALPRAALLGLQGAGCRV